MAKATVKTKTDSLPDTKVKGSAKPSKKILSSSEPKPAPVKKSAQKGKSTVPVKTTRLAQVKKIQNAQKSSDASLEQLFVGTAKSPRPKEGQKNKRRNPKGALSHQKREAPLDLSILTKNTIYSAWSAAKLFLIGFVFILLLGGAIYWIGTHARAGL